MSDLNGAVVYARRWIELHRENKFQREAAKIMQRVVDALESVRTERDASLARIAELEKELGLAAEMAALQRVRELHTLAERWVPANEEKPWRGFIRDGDKCESCNQVYPCPTIRALEGDE